MRYNELVENIKESMNFSAGHKDQEKGHWTSDTDSGDRYAPEFYKDSEKYMYGDDEAPANPDYKYAITGNTTRVDEASTANPKKAVIQSTKFTGIMTWTVIGK